MKKMIFPFIFLISLYNVISQLNLISSRLRRLPNSRINEQFWSLSNVSYKSGILHAHNLPQDAIFRLKTPFKQNTGNGWSTSVKVNDSEILYSSENILNPFLFENIKFESEPFNIEACSKFERRRILASIMTCHRNNCFITNSAHLQINIINPLLVYLYFVREEISSMDDLSHDRLSKIKLPLDNSLLLFSGGLDHSKALLFDFVFRFFSHVESSENFLRDINDGQLHCFENIDIVVPSSRWNWDSMIYTIKGRWGTGDFYRNFWRLSRQLIWNIYDVPLDVNKVARTVKDKPTVLWTTRKQGSGKFLGSRVDLNLDGVERIFSKYFNFEFLTSEDFNWMHSPEERLRHTQKTLLKLANADVLLGQHGANLFNGLYLQEKAIIIELKSVYGYCSLETGKTLANHNRLAFYTSDVRIFNNMDDHSKPLGVSYGDEYLEQLAKDISESFRYEVDHSDSVTARDGWDGMCHFLWPKAHESKIPMGRVLSLSNVSKCYLDETHPGEWFQMKARNYWERMPDCEFKNEINPIFKPQEMVIMGCPDLCL